MTRETKVGLLIGMGVILLVGIILTDHLSLARTRQLPNMTDFAPVAQHDLAPPAVIETDENSNRRVETPNRTPHRPRQRLGNSARRRGTGNDPDPRSARRVVDIGIAAVPAGDRPEGSARITHPQPGPVAIVHVVRRGEGLWELSQRYYGHGRHWRLIRDANPGTVAADNTIRAGAKLRIPERPELVDGADAAPPEESAAPGTNDPADEVKPAATPPIRVAARDTFGSLAQRHLGSSRKWRTLYDANRQRLGLDEPQALQVGMLLHLPRNADTDRSSATQRPFPSPARAPRTYVVARGDSLSSMAARHLGDAKHWRQIYDANRDILSNPDTLPFGRQIVIPQ